MEPARTMPAGPTAPIFEDAFGERHRLDEPAGGPGTDVLVLRASLAAVPSFEFAVRERANRLASFRHACFVRVRSVERGSGPDVRLRVRSDAASGVRLSDLLAGANARRVPIDINAALCLVRQLVPAVAMLHESARDVAHGAIAPERLMVTPAARLLIAEYVLGAALEQLRWSRGEYWKELRVPVPPSAGSARFDHRTDVTQIGMVALALILGRPICEDEFPGRIADVVASTWAVSPRGGFEPLPPGLRRWLGRTLQIDPSSGFRSAVEARAELDKVLGDSDYAASPANLEAFLTRFHASGAPIVESNPPAPPAPPVRPVVAPVAVPQEALEVPTPTPTPTPAPHDEITLVPPPAAPVESPLSDHTISSPIEAAAGSTWWRNRRVAGAVAAGVVVLLAGVPFVTRRAPEVREVVAVSGTLEVATSPAGIQVSVDGAVRGATPLTLALEPGPHVLVLQRDGESRSIPVSITAGAVVSHHVEMPVSAGSRPGPASASSQAATPPVSPASTQPASGWVTVMTPLEIDVLLNGARVGGSRERIAVPAGLHELTLVNQRLGVQIARTVQVAAGNTATVDVTIPNGTISVNAQPWADVWIDGERIGETPIGNVSLPVGSHDVLFRHPDLGERHHTALVTLTEPTRLSVDLRAP